LSFFSTVTVMSERLVAEYYLEHLRDPPDEPIPDQVASAAIKVLFDDPFEPVVHDCEVLIEVKGLVCIKQGSGYSKSDTGVLKSDSEVDGVAGLYLPDLFAELSTEDRLERSVLSVKSASSVNIERESK
jgi:hypothetical protein